MIVGVYLYIGIREKVQKDAARERERAPKNATQGFLDSSRVVRARTSDHESVGASWKTPCIPGRNRYCLEVRIGVRYSRMALETPWFAFLVPSPWCIIAETLGITLVDLFSIQFRCPRPQNSLFCVSVFHVVLLLQTDFPLVASVLVSTFLSP
jgi:hypothetical protein